MLERGRAADALVERLREQVLEQRGRLRSLLDDGTRLRSRRGRRRRKKTLRSLHEIFAGIR